MIDDGEIAYLCDAVNRHFTRTIAPGDVVSTWSGVRPLYDDGASEAKAVTRDYVLELDEAGGRRCSACSAARSPPRGTWPRMRWRGWRPRSACVRGTSRATARFPGGDIADFATVPRQVRARFPFLGPRRAERMARAYGTRLWEMLADVHALADMGVELGGGLTMVELGWMRTREWARTADDVLDRRSKLRLVADDAMVAAVSAAMRG